MLPERRNRQLPITNYALRSRAFRGLCLTPYFPLLALTLLAAWPLLTGGLPTVGDGLIHFHRFAQLDWHIRHGDFYPRWFVNLHYGFGAPVLNFYAPLSYYIPLVFRLFNLPLPASLLLGYALAFAVAIFGTYYWVRDQFDSPLAGLAASAAFGLTPYLYLNVLHRGAYPELWGLALAPWLLWSAHRLAALHPLRLRSGSFRSGCFIVIQSALILTHTLSALVFSPLALVHLLALSLSAGDRHSARRVLGFWLLGFGISLALTAFFTLPVLLESKDIQLFRTFLPGDLDYRNNFLTLSTLLSPPANFDPRLVFNLMPASLPWPQLALACIALLSSLRVREHRRAVLGFWILGFGICFLTLSASAPLWNTLPLARFIQFPWRLVGPASLLLAALAGLGLARLAPRHFGVWSSRVIRGLCLGFGVFFFFLFSLPWTYHVNFTSLPATVTPADAVNYETTTGQLGTTSAGEYLPRWVEHLPDPRAVNFAGNDLPSRLAPLPSLVTQHAIRNTIYSEGLDYESLTPFTATFNRFYFPGWTATLDGQSAKITPLNGLITVNAPAGQHTLRIELRPTAPQLVGTSLSLVTLAALTVLALRRPTIAIENRSYDRQPVFIISMFIVSLLIARILYFDRFETPFHHTNLDNLPNPISVNFDNQLELIGFEHPPTVTSNNQLPITIYWRALTPLTNNYSTTVQLADRFGNRFGQSDSQHPGRVPTSRWALDQYARDTHTLLSLPGTPPGNYHLLITVYADRPLSILQDNAPVGVEYDLGPVTVTRAAPQPPGPLTLVDLEMAARTVSVGDALSFTILLDSGNNPIPGLAATLTLADSDNQTLFSASIPPAGPDYPSEQWTPNELSRYPHRVGLPPDLPGGPARVSLTFVDSQGAVAAGPFDLGEITIIVPERSFVIPPMTTRVDHDFDKSIRLLGYDLSSDSITLYWQSLQPVGTRLTVFVHALDANGAFVAGHDATPARPTTGWLSGEVIADVHSIAVGERFEVGLYDPITGERFGETFVTRP